MTVDHLERANKDVGVTLDRNEALQLADARRLGNDLLKHLPMGAESAMARVQQDLHAVIDKTDQHVSGAKRSRGS